MGILNQFLGVLLFLFALVVLFVVVVNLFT